MSENLADWPAPPAQLSLGRAEVHVWRARLNQPPHITEALRKHLSADERERASRFRFQEHREHFTVARGVLRRILALYLGREPAQLSFAYTSYGKPSLSGAEAQTGLRFNLSHSGQLALYGFTLEREIGLDIEYRRADFATEDIAERFFSASEVSVLRALPRELQTEGFFNCWTRKEAYIKAVGLGLSLPLDKFDVSLAPSDPCALLRTEGDEAEAARWSLRALNAAEGYSAAVAVEGHGWHLKCWNWTSKEG